MKGHKQTESQTNDEKFVDFLNSSVALLDKV
jgi:hypothetical protein